MLTSARHQKHPLRVVSMVPSWTETLLHCGVNVVGRTRFCIHPVDQIKNIPAVGGTKNWDWDKIVEIYPDLILLDQEENPKMMSEQNVYPWHSTHIQSVQDMPQALAVLSQTLQNEKLEALSKRWQTALLKKQIPLNQSQWNKIPGLIEWGHQPTAPVKKIVYMIWKDPWMCVSRDTFIGSMLELFGIELRNYSKKYPEISETEFNSELNNEETLILFSSEPYPFAKKKSSLQDLKAPHAFVDGESLSWFGLRTLEFLERQ